jgi:hypothetical protein
MNEDRRFYEGHRGLGNSQKAEVAWSEEMGYAYEEFRPDIVTKRGEATRCGHRRVSAGAFVPYSAAGVTAGSGKRHRIKN